ncbi:hypothetical protein QQX98_006694 [Neonectria punicea]|uniref:GDP/GTP exchange factor Sec2 N-terminal domain-containing protein n=1 Tax=Neonectria punicea TaxID=979145 RepID=A0ABR1H022_9HYPO
MPFFGGRREPSPEPVLEPEPRKQGSFFHRSEPPTEPLREPVHEEAPKKHGLFGRRSPSPSPTTATRSTGRTSLSSASTYQTAGHNESSGGLGLFRRGTDASSSTARKGTLRRSFGNGNGHGDDDPSVLDARQRVQSAEAAEREADRALDEARSSVREAREQVKLLEVEAREEARRAKIKQHQAREVSKLGRALGRHGP